MAETTRRDILKKTAAAGAIAWGVPAIVSSTAEAGGGGLCGSVPRRFYQAKQHESPATTCFGSSNYGCSRPRPSGCGSITWNSGCGRVSGLPLSSTGGSFSLPSGAILLRVCVRRQGSSTAYSFDSTGSQDSGRISVNFGSRTVTLTGGRQLDAVIIYWAE